MERLTEHHIDKKMGAYMVCCETCKEDGPSCDGCRKMDELIDRLAAYEDTGLSPETVSDLLERFTYFYSGLVRIPPNDGYAIAKYFADQIKAMPSITSQPNDPLTLEELREMDGEPVWVEIPTCIVAEWCISKVDPLVNRVRLWGAGGGWFDGRNVGKSLFV